MLEAIQKMSHKEGTALGYSATTYGGIHIAEGFKNNIHGILQGNSSAPQIWYILISVIFSVLREQGFDIHFSK